MTMRGYHEAKRLEIAGRISSMEGSIRRRLRQGTLSAVLWIQVLHAGLVHESWMLGM